VLEEATSGGCGDRKGKAEEYTTIVGKNKRGDVPQSKKYAEKTMISRLLFEKPIL